MRQKLYHLCNDCAASCLIFLSLFNALQKLENLSTFNRKKNVGSWSYLLLLSYFKIVFKKTLPSRSELYGHEKTNKTYRQGNIINGKLKATDNTKPILIASLTSEGLRFKSIFPENGFVQNATYPKKPTKI